MLRKGLMTNAALVCVLGLALVNCGGGGPEGAVKGWYKAMNDGKHSEAIKYLAPAMAEFAKMDGGKAMSDEMTNNGTMTKVEILESNVRGEGAEVKARIHFKDGAVKDEDISLVKQDGDWKITLGF